MLFGKKPPALAPAPESLSRCQRYFDDGRGFDFTEKIHDAQLRFAFDFHRQTTKHGQKTPNRLTSPLGAYTVLTMLAAGAKGGTLSELEKTLYGHAGFTAGFDGVAATVAGLECPSEYRSTVLTAANRLFLGKGVEVLADYTQALKRGFNATYGTVDFSKKVEAAKAINGWVSEETRGNIPTLVDPGLFNADTRLVLVNALYALGTWADKFDPKDTKPKPFHLESGKVVNVPTMHQRHEYPTFLYAKRPKYETLYMTFADHLIDVAWILPAKGTKLDAVVGALDATEWDVMEKQLDKKPVDLALPKFKIAGQGSLQSALQALGIHVAFVAGKADFSGIDGGKNLLYVGDVIQKATAKVDELGFEGSAATAALMYAGGVPPQSGKPIPFVVDRPFAFVALHKQSGAVLFLGEVRDPR